MFWNKRRLKLISAMFFMTGLFLLAGVIPMLKRMAKVNILLSQSRLLFIPMNLQVNLNNQEMKSNRSYQKQQVETSKSS